MAQKKAMIVNVMMALVALVVVTSCMSDDEQSLRGAGALKASPVAYEPLDSNSVVVYYDDGSTVYPVKHHWVLEAEAPIQVKGTEAFKATEPLSKKAQDEVSFAYNYDKTNRLTVTGLAMDYKGKTIYPKNPGEMLVKGNHEVIETAVKPFYEESKTDYVLVHGNTVLASTRQMFGVREDYTPAFERMFWNSKHLKGTAKASYANAKVTIECVDSLRAWERWDDGSFKNWLRTIYHSQNVFNTTISGTEVTSFSSVVNKDMSISGNKATIAEFSVEFDLTSKTIKESPINYTYDNDNKSINFVDSLTACGYSLKDAKLTSKTNLHVVFTHEGEDVSVDIPVTLTEKEVPADVEVSIMRISITDAYKDQHKAQEGTYLHIFGKDKNGSYVVLSQRIGESAFKSTGLSAAEGKAIDECGRAIAYVFNNISNRYQIGTVTSEDGIANKGFYLCYYVAGGGLAYSLGNGTGTEALKDGFRDAIRGSVSKANADGTWTVTADGKTYTFKGL